MHTSHLSGFCQDLGVRLDARLRLILDRMSIEHEAIFSGPRCRGRAKSRMTKMEIRRTSVDQQSRAVMDNAILRILIYLGRN